MDTTAEMHRKALKKAASKRYYEAHKEQIIKKKAESRAANPEKAKAQAAEWYQANKERINEPKRRANFEANERDRERKCLVKGTKFTPRNYVSYTTNDSRTPAREIAKQRDRTMSTNDEAD